MSGSASRTIFLAACALGGFLLAFATRAPGADREALHRACVGDDAASCDELAELIDRGAIVAEYPEQSALYAGLACERGVARACERAQRGARMYPDYEVFEVDVGCVLRDQPAACVEVADSLRNEGDEGPGEVTDPATERLYQRRARDRMKRALDRFGAACERGEAAGCLGASRIHRAGVGDEWSPRRATGEERRACALGLPGACGQAGDNASGQDAVEFFRQACEVVRPDPHACRKLARAREATHAPGPLVAASYAHACELLAFEACAWVSEHPSEVGPHSPALDAALRRWCDQGGARGCATPDTRPTPRPEKT